MSDEISAADDVSVMDITPDESHANRLDCGNSQATSGDYSETDGQLEERDGGEFQHLPQQQAEIKGAHKSRAGVFSRLRKKLSSRSSQVSGSCSSSAVCANHIDGASDGSNSPIIIHKKRTPCYQCIPNPPGCIPTEVMMKVSDESKPFNSKLLNYPELSEGVIDGARKVCPLGDRKNNESIQDENVDLASNTHIYEYSKPPKVLYNNWIDPGLV